MSPVTAKTGRSELSRLRRDTRGAVLAEFVVAVVPLLTVFFTFVQLSKIATARLVVKHGAIIGARAAAVISNVNDNIPGAKGGGQGEIEEGVKHAMAPWVQSGAISGINVDVSDQSSRANPYGWVTVTVRATYECKVPLGMLVCAGKRKSLEESYRMPHQGARYRVSGGGGGGGSFGGGSGGGVGGGGGGGGGGGI